MAHVDWKKILGWSSEQLEEFRLAGFSLLREGKYEKALIYFKALVTLDSKDIYDIQTVGALHLQLGENEEALTFLNKALESEPAHEPTLLNKTKALLLTGKKSEAFDLAHQLEKSQDSTIANDASALILAYS